LSSSSLGPDYSDDTKTRLTLSDRVMSVIQKQTGGSAHARTTHYR